MFGNKVVATEFHLFKEGFSVIAALVDDFFKHRKTNFLVDCDFFKFIPCNAVNKVEGVNHIIGYNLNPFTLNIKNNLFYAGTVDCLRCLSGNLIPCRNK